MSSFEKFFSEKRSRRWVAAAVTALIGGGIFNLIRQEDSVEKTDQEAEEKNVNDADKVGEKTKRDIGPTEIRKAMKQVEDIPHALPEIPVKWANPLNDPLTKELFTRPLPPPPDYVQLVSPEVWEAYEKKHHGPKMLALKNELQRILPNFDLLGQSDEDLVALFSSREHAMPDEAPTAVKDALQYGVHISLTPEGMFIVGDAIFHPFFMLEPSDDIQKVAQSIKAGFELNILYSEWLVEDSKLPFGKFVDQMGGPALSKYIDPAYYHIFLDKSGDETNFPRE